MAQEQTLVLIKPDAAVRGLTGFVLDRLENAGLLLIGAKLCQVTEELARHHYRQLQDQPFFPQLIEYLTGKLHGEKHRRVLALVYYGEGAIGRVRKIAGATHPEKAEKTSLRGALGRVTTGGVIENLLHASSDPQEARREIQLWFQPHEIFLSLYPTKKVKKNEDIEIWS